MNVPESLKYSEDHEWARVEGGEAVIGITDFAQHELTDIVFVELPEVGKVVKKGEQLAVVESVKAVSDVYSPISGKVVAVNSGLEDAPELVNKSPYEDGWIAKLEVADAAELDAMMSADAYRQHIAGGE